jgi:hypothetical protein
MTTSETITFLRNFNGWRRGAYDKQPPRAQEVGKAIDDACDKIERFSTALQDIAALDTSQDASPQQCAAVLLAMNALDP